MTWAIRGMIARGGGDGHGHGLGRGRGHGHGHGHGNGGRFTNLRGNNPSGAGEACMRSDYSHLKTRYIHTYIHSCCLSLSRNSAVRSCGEGTYKHTYH